MDKRQFLEQVIERVRALDLSDIIGKYIELPKRVSGGYLGLCPFHNDTRLGSFVVTPRKGIFKCFACDAGGDGIKFVSLFNNISYVEAAFDIAQNEGIITPSEYDEFFKKRRYTKKETRQIEKVSLAKIKKSNRNNIGDDELLNIVFNVFLDALSLKTRHKKYLNCERQLDDETIEKRKYKSTQSATDVFMGNFIKKLKENKKLKKKMKKEGMKSIDEALELIPGFFQKKIKNVWKWDFAYNHGIFIPIKNATNQIIGLQVRRDKKDEDRGRYFWFSSDFASYKDNFRKGTSSGSPMDVLYPKKFPSKALFITEGRFKSEAVMSKIGAISLSIQGVGTWKNINNIIEKIEKEARRKYKGFDKFENICIAFDSDMSYKYQVYQQLKKMSDSIVENKKEKNVYYIHWTGEHKGIDDLLINSSCNSKKEYARLFDTHLKNHFDLEFEKQLRNILKSKGVKNALSLSNYNLNKKALKLPQGDFKKIKVQKKTS